MTLAHEKGEIVFACDACDDEFRVPKATGFDEAWAAAKAEGWTAAKVGNNWFHSCPACPAAHLR